jgi:hypothetical protein
MTWTRFFSEEVVKHTYPEMQFFNGDSSIPLSNQVVVFYHEMWWHLEIYAPQYSRLS